MKNEINVGIIIADSDEYAPLREKAESLLAERKDFYSREGLSFTLLENDKKINVHVLLCGIGMVNAATCATALCTEGVEVILNAGLSGGINGVARGELMLATEFVEHDFDLTPLGYPMCKKPGQEYIYYSDKELIDILKKTFPGIKCGVAASGDSFISDDIKKEFLKTEFNAMSCDMETAAIAYVADLAGIPFAAIRRISDDAGNNASSDYSEMNSYKDSLLIDLLLDAARALFKAETFWR